MYKLSRMSILKTNDETIQLTIAQLNRNLKCTPDPCSATFPTETISIPLVTRTDRDIVYKDEEDNSLNPNGDSDMIFIWGLFKSPLKILDPKMPILFYFIFL